ncbi:MAG: hypothetical protein ACOYZ7_15260 [Chloroflexota bacterium]
MHESDADWATLFTDLHEFEGQPVEPVVGELSIEGIELHPLSDGQRVTVDIAITPTQERPNIEVVVLAPDETVVAEMLIVEARSNRQVVTLHLRPPDASLRYVLKAALFRETELLTTYETGFTWP